MTCRLLDHSAEQKYYVGQSLCSPSPAALFASTQVARHRLFFRFPSLIVGTSNGIDEKDTFWFVARKKKQHRMGARKQLGYEVVFGGSGGRQIAS